MNGGFDNYGSCYLHKTYGCSRCAAARNRAYKIQSQRFEKYPECPWSREEFLVLLRWGKLIVLGFMTEQGARLAQVKLEQGSSSHIQVTIPGEWLTDELNEIRST